MQQQSTSSTRTPGRGPARKPGTGGARPAGGGGARFGDKRREGRFGGGDSPRGGRFFQKKICKFCAEKATQIDFKDIEKLRRFLTEKGKIIPRRITGNCAKCQRMLARAIKKARHADLVAFQID